MIGWEWVQVMGIGIFQVAHFRLVPQTCFEMAESYPEQGEPLGHKLGVSNERESMLERIMVGQQTPLHSTDVHINTQQRHEINHRKKKTELHHAIQVF